MRTHYLSCETAETQGNHACVKFLGGNINYLTDEELASSLGSAFIDISFLIWSISLALYSGFRRKAQVLKCRPFFGVKRGVIVSGVPCVNRGNWGWESSNLCYHVLAHVKLLKLKGNTSWENTEKKHMYDSMEPVASWCIQYCFLYCQLFNLF